MKWNSVIKDGVPKENILCIVFPYPNEELNIFIAEFQPWDNKWYYESCDCYGVYRVKINVTHWIEFPADPKGE